MLSVFVACLQILQIYKNNDRCKKEENCVIKGVIAFVSRVVKKERKQETAYVAIKQLNKDKASLLFKDVKNDKHVLSCIGLEKNKQETVYLTGKQKKTKTNRACGKIHSQFSPNETI